MGKKNTNLITPETAYASPPGKKLFSTKTIIIILLTIIITLGGVWELRIKEISKVETTDKPNPPQTYTTQSDLDIKSNHQLQSAEPELHRAKDSTGDTGQDQTSMVLAAAVGDMQAVQELLEQGKDPNVSEYVDDLGYCTALMASAAKGHIETARLLINRGVDKNAYNMQGYDALAYAAENNNLDMAKLLVNSGANPDRALGVATVDGNSEIVRLLLDAGANPNNIAARHQEAPLHLAASLPEGSDIILTLIQSGSNVNQTDMYGETPLFIAAQENLINNVRILLQNGANPNIKNTSGETPLKRAQTIEMKSLLQSFGAIL